MIPEILVLALACTVRPTSLAAVYTLLTHGSRRLLWVYVVAGLGFCIAFGVIVVGVFHGVHIGAGTSRTKGILDVVGGAIVLLFAVGVASGRVAREHRSDPARQSQWKEGFQRRLSVRTAAIAGPLTHIPGIFYLVALNVIVAHNPRLPGGLLAVVIFDVVWFTLPIVALALSIVRPDAAREMIDEVQQWSGRHARGILLTTSTIVGAALLIRGLISL